MCGIVGIWNREDVFPWEVVDVLFSWAEKRGVDGVGVVVCDGQKIQVKKFRQSYSEVQPQVRDWVMGRVRRGSLVLGICRARPETEFGSDEDVLQPVVKGGCCLVHNGSIAERVKEEVSRWGYVTRVDSEAILNGYFEYGWPGVLEKIIGGFAFLLYDGNKRRLRVATNFKPLAMGYVRGYGLVLASERLAVEEAFYKVTGLSRTGVNVWEDYWYDWVDGWSWRDVDLDSGMMREGNFIGRVVHPVFDFGAVSPSGQVKVLVSASGGIDSGLSGWILSKLGYQVELVHFDYGQKGEEAERLAVAKQAELGGMSYRVVDLSSLFKGDKSSLIDDSVEVLTGKKGELKTTTAWVSARNLVFWSVLCSLAEQEILKGYDEVWIVAGWSNLTEAGIYPDNSEVFVRKFQDVMKYGMLFWDRVRYVPLLQNLMKYEEWWLGYRLGFPFEWSVSCDLPKVSQGRIFLCRQCGSTLLSVWASKIAGVPDPRNFYDREVDYELEEDRVEGVQSIDLDKIVDRICFVCPRDKDRLLDLLG